MIDGFWLPLLIKAIATALVVVLASVAAEKSGPFWGGLIACLPISAGPAYVLLGMSQEPAFIAHSALSSYASSTCTWVFLITFVRLAGRWPLWPSLLTAIGAWLAVAVVVTRVPWTLTSATIVNVVAFALALRFTPRIAIEGTGTTRVRKWHELPMRGVLVGMFVAFVVTASDVIGPAATGVAAVFPIAMSSLAVVIHPAFGIRGSAAALSSAVRPLLGIVSALATVYLIVPRWGIWPGLATGLAVSFMWPLLLIAMRKRA